MQLREGRYTVVQTVGTGGSRSHGALSSPEILLFGPFRFDRRGRLLFRCTEDGRYLPVSVGSRAFAVLEVLTERPGDLVSKDEIMGVAWPGLTVEEGNLTVQISTLRRILDAGSEGESWIQTVSGRGYRFVPHVTRPEEESIAAMSPPAADPTELLSATAPARSRARSRRWLVAGSGVVATVVLLMAAMWHGGWLAAATPVDRRAAVREPERRPQGRLPG
jgi:DNA-binding winged helix-turn-helix (wHTH) protein